MRRTAPGTSTSRTARKGKLRHATAVARRATITLSPAAQEIVERFKNANGTSMSAAVDEIIQRSEPRPSRLRKVNGLLVLSDPPSNPDVLFHISPEEFKDYEDEMNRESIEQVLQGNRRPGRRTGKKARGRN